MNQWFKIAIYSFIGIVLGTLLLGIIAPGGNGYSNPYESWNMPGNFESRYHEFGNGYGYGQSMPPDRGMGMGMHGGMGMRGRR